MAVTALAPATRKAFRLPKTSWLRPFNDPAAIDGLMQLVNPLWSVDTIRARVVAGFRETADARTIWLQPNQLWPGFRAGQHIVLSVEIEGVRHQRTFSLSSAPQDSRIALTVKAHGKASQWLQHGVQPGDVVALSAPQGNFVLPEPPPPRLLLIGAGSGVTPLMSMLRDLRIRDHAGEVVFLQVCRDPADAIFGRELDAFAEEWKALRLLRCFTASDPAGAHSRPDAATLRALLPDFAEYHTLLCGPEPFMAMVRAMWDEAGASEHLQIEHFGIAAPRRLDACAALRVQCSKSAKSFDAAAGPLLADAERAGLNPKHGCRIGICHSCLCRKRSGSVENLLTGEISSEPDQLIQLCVSAARSDLELDL